MTIIILVHYMRYVRRYLRYFNFIFLKMRCFYYSCFFASIFRLYNWFLFCNVVLWQPSVSKWKFNCTRSPRVLHHWTLALNVYAIKTIKTILYTFIENLIKLFVLSFKFTQKLIFVHSVVVLPRKSTKI